MKKNHFLTLVICVLAGLSFSLGLCMCLLPEWDLFICGIVLTSIGGVSLITIGIISYIKTAKNKKNINWKLIGKITYTLMSVLIIGLGMAMIMEWNLIVPGIMVGVIGILMLVFTIPMFLGFKK